MPKPSLEELTQKYKAFSDKGGPLHDKFEVDRVDAASFKVDGRPGHPFTIGPRHIEACQDTHILNESVMEWVPCAHPGCRRPLSVHTYDTILFVRVLKRLTNKEAGNALFAIKPDTEADGIDGVAFLSGIELIEKHQEQEDDSDGQSD